MTDKKKTMTQQEAKELCDKLIKQQTLERQIRVFNWACYNGYRRCLSMHIGDNFIKNIGWGPSSYSGFHYCSTKKRILCHKMSYEEMCEVKDYLELVYGCEFSIYTCDFKNRYFSGF